MPKRISATRMARRASEGFRESSLLILLCFEWLDEIQNGLTSLRLLKCASAFAGMTRLSGYFDSGILSLPHLKIDELTARHGVKIFPAALRETSLRLLKDAEALHNSKLIADENLAVMHHP